MIVTRDVRLISGLLVRAGTKLKSVRVGRTGRLVCVWDRRPWPIYMILPVDAVSYGTGD